MKNKIIVKALVFEIILLFLGAGVVSGLNENSITNFKPMNNGNWLYVGGNESGNYSNIQDAIDNASMGDTVFVYDDSSPYQENIHINKQILVIGENKDTTIINGVTGQHHVVRIAAKNAEINGFTIIGEAGGQDGVVVYPLIEESVISNNIIKDCYYGILLQATSGRMTISDNIILNNDYEGLLLQDSDRNVITGNTIEENSHFGITMELNSAQNWIIGNAINDNFAGIQIISTSKQNNISGNQILNNEMEGILINGLLSTANEITGNNISSNKIGVKIYNGGKNIITSNNINDNSNSGIYLSVSNQNIIKVNNFIGNKRNAHFIFSFGNTWNSNYWDNWIGFKIPLFKMFPKTIRGIVLRNYDWNPQEEPYDI